LVVGQLIDKVVQLVPVHAHPHNLRADTVITREVPACTREDREQLRTLFADVVDGAQPAHTQAPAGTDDNFGLTAILDGIEQYLARRGLSARTRPHGGGARD